MRKGTIVGILVLALIVSAGCQNRTETARPERNDGGSEVNPQQQAGKSISPPTEGSTSGKNTELNPAAPAANDIQMGKITAVRIANPDSGWVGGDGWIARTDDGGQNWQVQYQGPGTVNQLFALNTQVAWAAVTENTERNERVLLSTADGGQHWTLSGKVPNQGFLHFVSAQEGYSANAKTTDGGQTWSHLPVPDHMAGDAYFHDKDHGWAVTQDKGIFKVNRTTDRGYTWQIVMSRKTDAALNGALIRSAGADDAWVECIGDSGMTQTSYSLFHTSNGGQQWQTVIANATAGAGPAPGILMNGSDSARNTGAQPGTLYVVSPEAAYMGGKCMACDKPNTMGWTTDGGKTWMNGKQAFEGYGEQLVAIADENHGWWICTDNTEPSVMYSTSDGGEHWIKVHGFDPPKSDL